MAKRTPASSFDDPGYVKALAHPMRVSIIARLQERRATPRELAEWLDASLGVVSYHVRTLHKLGLIELVGTTQVRGAIAHHYRAKERPRISDEAWAAASPVAKQAAVAATLATIREYADASHAAGGFERDDAGLTAGACGWTPRAGRRPRPPACGSSGCASRSRRRRRSATPRTRTPTASTTSGS